MTFAKAHRYLGLGAGLLWLFQILSGSVLVFRAEMENFVVAGAAAPVSVAAIGARLQAIQQAGGEARSMWVANSAANRFVVYYADASGADRAMRIDGAGRVLTDAVDDGGVWDTIASLHQRLSAGDVGKWVLTVSGVLLFSNLVLGLKLAWPRAGTWRRTLIPQTVRNPKVRLYGLHRAFGLWAAGPALFVVGAGILLLHQDAIESVVAGEMPEPKGNQTVAVPVTGPGTALAIALAQYPGATLTMLAMPHESSPWYRVRLHAPAESPRMYGATTLYLSAADGRVLQRYEVGTGSAGRVFIDGLYPFHTGSLGGFVGRMLLVALGLLLIVLGVYGLRMWLARSQRVQV
jgi:uncharacterized iron-regulated membrane protein